MAICLAGLSQTVNSGEDYTQAGKKESSVAQIYHCQVNESNTSCWGNETSCITSKNPKHPFKGVPWFAVCARELVV